MKGGWDAEDQARHSGACSLTQRGMLYIVP